MFDFYSLIEKYLKEELPQKSRITFEKEMEHDRNLKEVVEGHVLYSLIADRIIDKKIVTSINEVDAGLVRKKRIRFLGLGMSMAAVLCILIIAYPNLTSPKVNGDELYSSYYFQPNGDQLRSENGSINFDANDFQKGHTYLELGNIEKAKVSFDKVLKDGELPSKQKALYFSGLIALKEGDIPLSKKYLSQLININIENEIHIKAKSLLLELE